MQMYNPKGEEVLVNPDQVKILLAAGYTVEKPAVVEKQEPAKDHVKDPSKVVTK